MTDFLHPYPVAEQPKMLFAGQLAEGFDKRIDHYFAEGAVFPGGLLVRGSSDEQAQHPPELPVADPDAILVDLSSSTSDQELFASDFNGVIAGGRIFPCRAITLTFSGTTGDFGTPTIELELMDADGVRFYRTIDYPGGAITLTLNLAASQLTRIFIPAGSGTNGVLNVGVSNARVEFGTLDTLGIALALQAHYETDTDFADKDSINAVSRGIIVCLAEETAAVSVGTDDPVYVRIVESGSDLRGQLSGIHDDDDANWALVRGIKWNTAVSAGELSWVKVNVP